MLARQDWAIKIPPALSAVRGRSALVEGAHAGRSECHLRPAPIISGSLLDRDVGPRDRASVQRPGEEPADAKLAVGLGLPA